jgi:lactoylglutathione lyase
MAKATVSNLSFSFHHTMLPVANLDRSVAFYRDLFGMTLVERHASEARKVEVALVGYGKTRGPFLELTQNTGPTAPERVTPLNSHIAIDVTDLPALCGMLEEAGVKFTKPLKAANPPRKFSAWVADPDGHALELAQRESTFSAGW